MLSGRLNKSTRMHFQNHKLKPELHCSTKMYGRSSLNDGSSKWKGKSEPCNSALNTQRIVLVM